MSNEPAEYLGNVPIYIWYSPEGDDPPFIKERIAASIDWLEWLANEEDE